MKQSFKKYVRTTIVHQYQYTVVLLNIQMNHTPNTYQTKTLIVMHSLDFNSNVFKYEYMIQIIDTFYLGFDKTCHREVQVNLLTSRVDRLKLTCDRIQDWVFSWGIRQNEGEPDLFDLSFSIIRIIFFSRIISHK